MKTTLIFIGTIFIFFLGVLACLVIIAKPLDIELNECMEGLDKEEKICKMAMAMDGLSDSIKEPETCKITESGYYIFGSDGLKKVEQNPNALYRQYKLKEDIYSLKKGAICLLEKYLEEEGYFIACPMNSIGSQMFDLNQLNLFEPIIEDNKDLTKIDVKELIDIDIKMCREKCEEKNKDFWKLEKSWVKGNKCYCKSNN